LLIWAADNASIGFIFRSLALQPARGIRGAQVEICSPGVFAVGDFHEFNLAELMGNVKPNLI